MRLSWIFLISISLGQFVLASYEYVPQSLQEYHNYAALTQHITQLQRKFVVSSSFQHCTKLFSALWNCFFRYPDMVLVYNIGQSVRKRKLWVTRISPEAKHSKQNRQRRKLLKPMVKIVANMHGNEVSFSSAFIEARRPTSKRVLILQGCRQRIEFGFGGLFAQGILRLGSKDTTTAQRYRLAHFTFHESGWVWICNSNMRWSERKTKRKWSMKFCYCKKEEFLMASCWNLGRFEQRFSNFLWLDKE